VNTCLKQNSPHFKQRADKKVVFPSGGWLHAKVNRKATKCIQRNLIKNTQHKHNNTTKQTGAGRSGLYAPQTKKTK